MKHFINLIFLTVGIVLVFFISKCEFFDFNFELHAEEDNYYLDPEFEDFMKYDHPTPPKHYIDPNYDTPTDRVFDVIEKQEERRRLREYDKIQRQQKQLYWDHILRPNKKDD